MKRDKKSLDKTDPYKALRVGGHEKFAWGVTLWVLCYG